MVQKVPIDAGIIARAIAGVRYAIHGVGSDSWFGPSQPLAPSAQEQAKGRQLDYPFGFNIKRSTIDEGSVTYPELRALADGYDLLRLVIETRKDQISKLEFEIVSKKDKKASDRRIKEVQNFFCFPDKEHDWDTWVRAIIEEMLVTDATTIYPRMNNAGKLWGLELMDGATIKRLIDDTGRTPLPPNPAYQQILKGVPAVDYSRDELIYRPRNVRVHKFYGYSPVEQVIMTVNIAMRRQVSQLQHYTEGNVPEALIAVPAEWSPDQIEQFQTWWDGALTGDLARKSKAKFVPGGVEPVFTKADLMKDGYDEWLARIICFAFNISPQSLVAMMNRATAETAQKQAMQEGLAPLQKWLKNLVDYVIFKYFGYDDIEMKWAEEDEASSKEQMEINCGYHKEGILTTDEVRANIGKDPLTEEQKAEMAAAAPAESALPGQEDDGKTPPGTDAPPGTGEQPPEPKEAASEKLGKSVRRLPTINRNRASVKNAMERMTTVINRALKEDLIDVLSDVSMEKLSKSESMNGLKSTVPTIRKIYKGVYDDGVDQAELQLGVRFNKNQLDQLNEKGLKWSKSRSAELIKDITETTRDGIKTLVNNAYENGISPDSLAQQIRDSFLFSDARSSMIARTELAFADVQGNLDSYKESGVVKGKQWITSADPCEDCLALSDVIVGIDEDFPDGGGDGPPLHPHCECDVIPVIDEA